MKQLLTGILSVMFIVNVKSQTLDQDYITGIPTTTSFGGQPLGADNDQGQSFTAGAHRRFMGCRSSCRCKLIHSLACV